MPGTPMLKPVPPAILAVDDDPFALEHVKVVLNALGYQALTANGTVRGLACAVKYRPQAILLDLFMPEADGFAFLSHRRKLAEIEQTPIIVLTANHAQDDVRRAIDLGACDYLVKPIDKNHLASRLERVVPSPFYSPVVDSSVDWGIEHRKSLI